MGADPAAVDDPRVLSDGQHHPLPEFQADQVGTADPVAHLRAGGCLHPPARQAARDRLFLHLYRVYFLRSLCALPTRGPARPDARLAAKGCENEAGKFRITFLREQPGGYSLLFRSASHIPQRAVSLGKPVVAAITGDHNNTNTSLLNTSLITLC